MRWKLKGHDVVSGIRLECSAAEKALSLTTVMSFLMPAKEAV